MLKERQYNNKSRKQGNMDGSVRGSHGIIKLRQIHMNPKLENEKVRFTVLETVSSGCSNTLTKNRDFDPRVASRFNQKPDDNTDGGSKHNYKPNPRLCSCIQNMYINIM